MGRSQQSRGVPNNPGAFWRSPEKSEKFSIIKKKSAQIENLKFIFEIVSVAALRILHGSATDTTR